MWVPLGGQLKDMWERASPGLRVLSMPGGGIANVRGIEEGKRYVLDALTAFPDAQVSVEDVIAEGDKVVTRYTIRGTHQGETEEFGPPTGKRVELEGITIHRIEGDKIVEEWERYDNLSALQQLGIAPEQ